MTKPNEKRRSFAGMFRHKIGSGHFEVFWHTDYDDNEMLSEGWYWWTCEPGCIPDSEPFGPFNTSRLAWKDAKYGT